MNCGLRLLLSCASFGGWSDWFKLNSETAAKKLEVVLPLSQSEKVRAFTVFFEETESLLCVFTGMKESGLRSLENLQEAECERYRGCLQALSSTKFTAGLQ